MSWRNLFRRDDPIEEELDAHLRMAIAERVARGESRTDAERNSRRELGNVTLLSQVTREARRGPMVRLDGLAQETRVAVRSLLKTRAFTLGTIGCWAIAIAAHGAMLAIVDQVFARPPAHVWDAKNVLRLYRQVESPPPRPNFTTPAFTFMAANALRRDGGRVAEFAAHAAFEPTAELPGGARTLRASAITRNYFSLLGVRPAIGIFPSDGMPTLDSCAEGMVISHALWASAFEREVRVVGTTVRINDRSLPVCAVAPDGFTGGDPSNPEVWIPIEIAGPWARGDNWREARFPWLTIVARNHWFATDELGPVVLSLIAPFDSPRQATKSVIAASLVPGRAPDGLAKNRTIIWLAGAATLLLLLATLNVSTMVLLRTLERQPELALRRVLGASGGTIARIVAMEVLAVGVVSAAAGIVLAQMLRPVLQQLLGVDAIPIPFERVIAIEGTVLLAATAIASIAPIWIALGTRRSFEYRADPRSTTSGRAGRLRGALLVLQVASCVVLVAGALAMGATLTAVREIDLGLDANQVLYIEVGDQFARAQGAATTRAMLLELQQKAAKLPGVTASAVTLRLPFAGLNAVATWDESRQLIRMPSGAVPFYTSATHGYMKTIGAKLLRGRDFTPADDASADRVAIVNATFASVAYTGGNAVGRCIYLGDPKYGPCNRIVGVIADQRRYSILPEEAMLEVYVPLPRDDFGAQRFVALRTAGDPEKLIPAAAQLARATFPTSAPFVISPLSRRLDPQVRPFIAGTRLLSIYSLVAFIVAIAGILGTLAYLTRLARRTTAIRMALGATQLRATLSVARTGFGTTLGGLAIGGAAALLLRERTGTLLFGIERLDVVALVLQAMALVGIAGAIASLIPAWRGSRADVFRSLNAE